MVPEKNKEKSAMPISSSQQMMIYLGKQNYLKKMH